MDINGIIEVADALGLLVGRPYNSDKHGWNVSISCPLAEWAHSDKLDGNKSCSVTLDADGPSKAFCHSFSCNFSGSFWYLVQRAVQARNPVPPQLAALVQRIAKTEEPTLERGFERADATIDTLNATEAWALAFKPITPVDMSAMPKTRDAVVRAFDRDILDERFLEQFSKDLPAYVWERGITKATAERWGLLYDERLGRVVFPVRRFDDKLVGVTGRILPAREADMANTGYEVTKYHNYSGLNKTRYLYGAHTWKKGWPVVLTEGPFDALKTWQALHATFSVNVGATLGQGFGADHRVTVRNADPPEVYLFFDDDAPGHRAAEKVAAQLEGAVKMFLMRTSGGKDPGAMQDATICGAYASAKPILGDVLAAIAGLDPLA